MMARVNKVGCMPPTSAKHAFTCFFMVFISISDMYSRCQSVVGEQTITSCACLLALLLSVHACMTTILQITNSKFACFQGWHKRLSAGCICSKLQFGSSKLTSTTWCRLCCSILTEAWLSFVDCYVRVMTSCTLSADKRSLHSHSMRHGATVSKQPIVICHHGSIMLVGHSNACGTDPATRDVQCRCWWVPMLCWPMVASWLL